MSRSCLDTPLTPQLTDFARFPDAGTGREGPDAPLQKENRCAVEQGAGAGWAWGCVGACEHQKRVGHGKGDCLKLEPAAACLHFVLILSSQPSEPEFLKGPGQRAGNALLGVERDSLQGGAFQAFFTALGVRW